jgi:2-polyprenyl-3-methyl-5-hydroxy-6-metoxy-1,4-benzoquinol methylase
MSDRQFPQWDEFYKTRPAETMPWFHQGLDPDQARAIEQHAVMGRALDLGTGPGTQALALAERGFEVTATDLSSAAVDAARERALAAGLSVSYLVDDVTKTRLTGPFQLVLDRGCFHVLAPDVRPRYAETLARLVEPGGFYFLKCFSDEQPGEIGPYKFAPSNIEALFLPAFEVLSIIRSVYHGTLDPAPRALFCSLRRR